MIATTKPKQYRAMQKVGVETDANGRQMLVLANVPILDEHVDDDGLVHDERLLRKIALNNNQRIDDTGDYVPIVAHHTSEDDDPNKDPEVLGMAGPFFVAKFGRKKPRQAIYAKRWKIYLDKLHIAKDRNRRSVEIWPEDKPENRYIDPIAVLGAETPRRDLGMIHYKQTATTRPKLRYQKDLGPICYEMAGSVASGTNTFVPSATPQKPKKHDKGNQMNAFSPEQLQQLGELVKNIVQAEVAEQKVGLGQVDDLVDTPELGGEIAPDETPVAATIDDGIDGNESLGEGLGDTPENIVTDPAQIVDPNPMGTGEDLEDEEDHQYAKNAVSNMMSRYMKDDGEFDHTSATGYMKNLSDEDRGKIEKYMKCDSCDADEDTKNHYAKINLSDDQCIEKESSTSAKYQKLRKERDDYVVKYQKAQHALETLKKKYSKAVKENAQIKDEIAAEKQKTRYQKRKVALTELKDDGYIFDLDAELNAGESLDDQQWEAKEASIKLHYQKADFGDPLNMERALLNSQPTETPTKKREKKDADKLQRYAKSAEKITTDLREKGHENVEFVKVLRYMEDNETDEYPESEYTS